MTEEEIRKWSRELQDTPLFGAMQRYHNEVLPRDRPLDSIVKNADGTDMWTGDVVTGGANAYLVRSMMGEYYIARSKGRNADQALGDGFDAAIKSYNQGPGGNPQ